MHLRNEIYEKFSDHDLCPSLEQQCHLLNHTAYSNITDQHRSPPTEISLTSVVDLYSYYYYYHIQIWPALVAQYVKALGYSAHCLCGCQATEVQGSNLRSCGLLGYAG